MADKAASKKRKMEQVRALFEQERQREQEMGTRERFALGEAYFEAAEEGTLDEPVSNEGGEAAFVDVSGSSYGKEGQPRGESIEVEATGGAGREAVLEVAVEAAGSAADESLWLDAYWASHGDASTRALLRSQSPDTSILEVVIGEDDRREITITSEYPWRAICSLLITGSDGSGWIGTGWLVGPRILMTAGHCVYLHNNGGWAQQIEVVPGRHAAERPYGSVVATSFRSVRGWVQNRDRLYDYGAILLPENQRLGDETGWFGYVVRPDDALSNIWVNISGYPGDKPSGTQWFHAKEVAQVEDRVLTYVIDTAGGQSGAPVWIKLANGSRYGVGIHTNGHVTGNSATRISQPVFDNIKAWRMSVP
jgi:glutamyl endopeptidase